MVSSSFIRAAVVAGLAAVASAQFTNSSTTSTSATSSASPSASALPASVPGWKYDGCAAPPSAAGFPGFALAESSPLMTIERCTADCATSRFAGVVGGSCYCSQALSNGTSFVADASCSTACPGNPKEACGGPLLASRKRQAAGSVLSLYENVAAVVPSGNIFITVNVAVYVTVCATCPGGLTTVTYTGTVTATGCGCATQTKPAIPCTTVYAVCGCGPAGAASTVTLVVPTAVASSVVSSIGAMTQTVVVAATTPAVVPAAPVATTTGPAVFKGAASNVQAGSMGLFGLLMAVVALF